MNRRACARSVTAFAVSWLIVALEVLSTAPARAEVSGALGAPQHVVDARREGRYSFCSKPKLPLSHRERALCPLAAETEECEGFAAACRRDVTKDAARTTEHENAKPKSSSTPEIGGALGALARLLVYVLVLAVIAAVAFPIVLAILRARRDKSVADAPKPANVAVPAQRAPPPEAEAISDAEAALREADEHARRGDLTRALGLYLAATLAALDRRGAIRLARHRTNGEYVRSCADDVARQPLREIVREVDRVEFGKLTPTSEGVAHVARRAASIARATGASGASRVASLASMIVLCFLAFAVAGCGAPTGGGRSRSGGGSGFGGRAADDPSGDELPIDVLRRSGYDAAYLTTSLSAMPIPGEGEVSPVVAVDVSRVALEEETTAHVMRWVDAGGVLVLFGAPAFWPAELHATEESAKDDHVDVISRDVHARGARVGVSRALTWPDSEGIAFAGKSVYAAHIDHGKGAIVGVAGHELFTNIGVARPDNAGAFVALFDVAMRDRRNPGLERGVVQAGPPEIRVARRDDGIASPSNPFSALVQAGLGKGAWHALAAAIVLFLAFGIRHARPRPNAAAARRAFAEHVEATGAFYGRARAMGHALASYGRFAEMRLRERVPRGTDPVQFLAARAKVAPEEAARVWKRATEAKADDPPRGDELTTIRDLGAMLAKALETG